MVTGFSSVARMIFQQNKGLFLDLSKCFQVCVHVMCQATHLIALPLKECVLLTKPVQCGLPIVGELINVLAVV